MIGDVPKHPHSVGPTDEGAKEEFIWLGRGGCCGWEASFWIFAAPNESQSPSKSTQTVAYKAGRAALVIYHSDLNLCLGSAWTGVTLWRSMMQKIKPLRSWGQPFLCTLRGFVSQKLQMQRHRWGFHVHLLSSSSIFQRMCPLPDTRLNSYVAFQAKKAYHPNFQCAVKSNKWNPCGHSHALEMPLCVKRR